MDSDEYLTKINVVELVREIRNSNDAFSQSKPKKAFPYIETFCSSSTDRNLAHKKVGKNFYYNDTLKFTKASFSLGRLFNKNIISQRDPELLSKRINVKSSFGKRNFMTNSKDSSDNRTKIFSNSFIQKVTPVFRNKTDRNSGFTKLALKNKAEIKSPGILVNRIINKNREMIRKISPLAWLKKNNGKKIVIEIDCAQKLESSFASLSLIS